MLMNSGEENQAQVCAPSSHSTKRKGDPSDLERVEIQGLLPTIRAGRCWYTLA